MLYAVLSARPPGQLIVGALRPRRLAQGGSTALRLSSAVQF